MWPVSPAPVVSSQTILDGKPSTNKSSTQGRNTACGCVPAWLPALNFALVFKTPGIYFKKIQLLFTLRWPLALHDIIPVSCRINLPANPSFTRDNYFKKIQLLFTLRWPLALHDIIPVSCRINLPANPSFTRDIYLILWKPGAQLKMPCPLESPCLLETYRHTANCCHQTANLSLVFMFHVFKAIWQLHVVCDWNQGKLMQPYLYSLKRENALSVKFWPTLPPLDLRKAPPSHVAC